VNIGHNVKVIKGGGKMLSENKDIAAKAVSFGWKIRVATKIKQLTLLLQHLF
jgi:hypothetical protein